ncbi:MAG: PIG-L family deacetylase [Candidatus Hydrogenedentes bacterium]|nr:PIG-L family deacetylase [Candidatus Hydrogenedentota bacterium]
MEGYPDCELNEVNPNVLRGQIMAVIREIKPDIVMSWDPFAPCEDHPDHRMVAMATLEAAAFSSNPLFYPDHADLPHMVTEAYWFAKQPWNAECIVDISSTIDKKLEALFKHDCQMALTIDALARESETIGANAAIARDMPPEQYRPIIEMGMRQFCAAAGAKAGMAYAEQFRYEKLGMLDKVLGTNFVEPDF